MHRYLARTLIALSTAAALVGVGVAPAQAAAPVAVNMTFVVRPGPATQNTPLTLSGRVWLGTTGNAARVHLYFQRNGRTAWGAAGYVQTDDRGYFTKTTTAIASGTWKAVFNGTTARRGTLRTATSRVTRPVPAQIATYTSSQSMWSSALIRVPTRDYRVDLDWTCADTESPDQGLLFGFGYDDFLGDPYDIAFSEDPSGSLTMNGHNGNHTAYFQAYNFADCTWTAKVYAGTRAVTV